MASSINLYVDLTQISYFQSQFLNHTPKGHHPKPVFKIKLIFYFSFSRHFLLIAKLTSLLGFRRIYDPQIPSPFTPYQATGPVNSLPLIHLLPFVIFAPTLVLALHFSCLNYHICVLTCPPAFNSPYNPPCILRPEKPLTRWFHHLLALFEHFWLLSIA